MDVCNRLLDEFNCIQLMTLLSKIAQFGENEVNQKLADRDCRSLAHSMKLELLPTLSSPLVCVSWLSQTVSNNWAELPQGCSRPDSNNFDRHGRQNL
jgi:hypothetical protein